ncbi:MAG: FAD-dependent oxidoreductase [Leptolyngbya foveolarum]|uniref:malate dehydrogenase (quinone) n=1 Tax=Leptolyngbya foveolarum TaxID=47253 RepID=A0A2W4W0Z1_9CYAN|nr:MAG: FAD-dependent oxidoreductase [Leptolyngbya foveolarum]
MTQATQDKTTQNPTTQKTATQTDNIYDVVIVGGGVCGTALLYSLSHYTNVNKIALIEKNAEVALVNSKQSSNSQTLHFGDIETNYSLEKATRVNQAAMMVKNYVLKNDVSQEIHTLYHKMVLAIGELEGDFLRDRYETFKDLFPALRIIDRKELADIEPKVVEGRDDSQEMIALFTPDGYTIDFQKLSQSFVKNATQKTDKSIDLMTDTRVKAIQLEGDLYRIETADKTILAKAVAVTSGAHSLLFAKRLGYGQDYALLSAAGSFYFAPAQLNGKVYMVQMKKLPFAAIHGDPEVHDASQTRFGPTAKVLPMLERHRYGTILEYFKTAGLSFDAFRSFFSIVSDLTILWYLIMNFIYDLPIIGKLFFIRKVRKIIPSVKLRELKYAKGYGGIRPQIVNLKSRKLEMGQAKLTGKNIIFNITPSPGASTCLKNAEDDTRQLIEFLGEGYSFDQEKFSADLA